jgi:hypothetical protein
MVLNMAQIQVLAAVVGAITGLIVYPVFWLLFQRPNGIRFSFWWLLGAVIAGIVIDEFVYLGLLLLRSGIKPPEAPPKWRA